MGRGAVPSLGHILFGRPGVVCVLRIGEGRGAQLFTGESSGGDRPLHDTVTRLYCEVPGV
jgi:hypothetical protein